MLMKKSFLDKILYLSIFFFIVSLIIFFIFFYLRPAPTKGLKINFIGPDEVNSLENYSYKIIIENNSNQDLNAVNLKIFLSDGSFFVDQPLIKEKSISLGSIAVKKMIEQKFDLFFLNEGEMKENLKVVVSYKIGNKEDIFETEKNFAIFVQNPPLKIQIFLPEKIYINQEFQASFRIINLSKQKLNDVKIFVEPPSYFSLVSSFPKTENYYFQFSSINSLETKEISLIGQIQDVKSNGLFSAKSEFNFLNQSFRMRKEIAKVNILENPVVFEIKSNPSNQSIPIGSNLHYEIKVKNKSQSILENSEIKVKFYGPFDLRSLNSDGYFSELEQNLVWNGRNIPKLLKFKPKDEVDLNFSISLFQSYPILGENNKNFSVKIRIEFRSESIPVEVETSGKEYFVWQEDEKKISGNVVVDSDLVYNDNYFSGTGPFPLENNIPTTLAWHIRIKTIGEDFDNFSLNTKLPLGVNLTGKIAGDAILDNLKFDPKSGIFIYSLNNLPANLGYLEKEIDLVFQIVVVPPANVDLNNFIIIPQIQYSTNGSFSKIQFQNSIQEIFANRILK